MQGIE